MTAIRAFIAIDLNPAIREELANICANLRTTIGSSVRWVPPENVHITIKFLGDVSPANVELICHVLKRETEHHSSFVINVQNIGAFPSINRPRVIWVGVTAPPALAMLQRSIDLETHHLGYPSEERPFSPHLTIGRVSQHATPDDIRLMSHAISKAHKPGPISLKVDSVNLYQSDLTPEGAHYTLLFSAALAG